MELSLSYMWEEEALSRESGFWWWEILRLLVLSPQLGLDEKGTLGPS